MKAMAMRVQKKEQNSKALRTLNFNLGVRVNSDALTKLRSMEDGEEKLVDDQ